VEERAKLIQSMVGGAIRLKFTPELRFQVGDAVAEGNRVIALLDELQSAAPASTATSIPPA
jgi:ribosome-binding factor A